MFDATARISNVAQTQVLRQLEFCGQRDNVQNSISGPWFTLEEGKKIMPRIGLSAPTIINFQQTPIQIISLWEPTYAIGETTLTFCGLLSFSSMSSNDIDDFEAYDLGLASAEIIGFEGLTRRESFLLIIPT